MLFVIVFDYFFSAVWKYSPDFIVYVQKKPSGIAAGFS